MADSRVTFDLIARDHASRTVGQVGDSVDRLTKRITHLAGAFGGAFVLQQAGEYALKMADQFEASRARVENITRNLGGSFDAISGQVQSLDDRLAAFGFTNADVEGSFASLESVTKSSGKAFKDAALAADIARGRGISLAEATSILMRVETGHVAMLSRLGIATKDANGHLLTQGQALDMLREKYKGAAAAFSQTAAGEQAALRAQLGNTASQIGVSLLPAFVDLARVLQKDVLPPLQHAADFFDRNRKSIEPLIGALLKLTVAYKAVKLASRLTSALSIARGGAAAIGGAEGAGALSAWSLARPLPVFVVNNRGGLPGVVGTKGAPALEGEAATLTEGAGSVIGLQMAANLGKGLTLLSKALTVAKYAPLAFVGAQSDQRFPNRTPAAQGVYAADAPLIHSLPKPQQAAAWRALAAAAFGPDGQNPAKLKQLEAGWRKVVASVDDAANAEYKASRAMKHANDSLHHQAKELARTQSRSLALANAQDDMTSALRAMAISAGENGKALSGNSAKALANRDALRGAVAQAQAYIQTLKDQHVSQQKVAATAEALAGAIDKSATSTFGNRKQVVALLRQLHFLPGQIHDALTSTQSVAYNIGVGIMANLANGIDLESSVVINHAAYVAGQTSKAMRLAAGLDAQPGQLGPQTIDPKASKKAHDYGKNIAQQVTQGYVPVIKSGIDKGTSDAMKTARSRMQSEFAQIKQALASEKQSLISTFSSLDLSPTTDSLGASGPPKSLLSQIKANARRADTFTHLYFRLAKAGASQTTLAMFRDLGPDGIPTMREWLNHPKELRQANRAERQTARDAGRIAVRDTQDVYGKAIHRDLQHLPHKLAKEFAHDLRKIHIHVSLSEVDRKNGRKVKASP